jgi:hypothetical protein
MTDEELERFVSEQKWHFAKTMPQWPHWYCLRSESEDKAGFEAFVTHILSEGYEAEFRPADRAHWATRRYLDLGEFHYWSMDPTAASTTLINRARHPNVAIRLPPVDGLPSGA